MSPQVLSVIIYVVVTVAGRFISQRAREIGQPLTSQLQTLGSDPSAIGVGLAMAIAVAGAVIEYTLRENGSPLQLQSTLIGMAILAVGWGIAYFANKAIGDNWSASIDKTASQRLVDSGVYRFVRHPLYLSGWFILIGTNVYFQNRMAWLGVVVAFVAVLLRIPIEERRLEENFGEEYRAYKHRTRMLLPWIF